MPEHDRKTIVVRFKDNQSSNAQQIVDATGGVWNGKYIKMIDMISIRVPEGIDADILKSKYEAIDSVRHAYFAPIMEKRAYNETPCEDIYVNDTSGAEWTSGREPSGWAFRRVNAHHAWKYTKGSSSIKVCVVDDHIVCDSNLVPKHSSLDTPDSTSARGYAAVDYTGYSHGTNVYSALCANHTGGITRGMAPDCYKIFISNGLYDEEMENYYTVSMEGLDEAVTQDAHLVNISWGWYKTSGYNENEVNDPEFVDLKDACAAIYSNGGLVFVAGGNYGYNTTYQNHDNVSVYPNEYPNVIEIGAIAADPTDTIVDDRHMSGNRGSGGFASEYGHGFPLMAPGKIPLANCRNEETDLSMNWTSGIYYGGGSSFASPLAMGCAALVWSINPSLTNTEVRDIIFSTASMNRNVDAETYWPDSYGVINAGKAVAKARATLVANSGVPIPYLGFLADDSREMTTFSNDVPSTTLTGTVYIDVAGFCDDTITSVELWLGNVKKYDGDPAVLVTTTTSSGSPQTIKVIARAGTAYTEETYTDIIVDTLSVSYIIGSSTIVSAQASISTGVTAPTFSASTTPSVTYGPRYWNGSSWNLSTMKRYNGTGWVTTTQRR